MVNNVTDIRKAYAIRTFEAIKSLPEFVQPIIREGFLRVYSGENEESVWRDVMATLGVDYELFEKLQNESKTVNSYSYKGEPQ